MGNVSNAVVSELSITALCSRINVPSHPTTSSRASGLIQSQTNPTPDLIILDWNLPDFSGIDICQRIRAHGVTTPILMLTGHDEVTDRVKALDAGVDDYLIKPFPLMN